MSTNNWLVRTELLIGSEKIELLRQANVLVVGLGGVGSFAAEFLCRAGIGSMTIVDGDVVDVSNKNRQLPALDSTVGMPKAEVMAQRMLDINPELQLTVIQTFQQPDYMAQLVRGGFDYVLDCIDSFQPKISLLADCLAAEVNFISSMGAGGRVDPAKVKVDDVFSTYNCPFAQQVRKFLRIKGINKGFPVVFSTELVMPNSLQLTEGSAFKKSYYGTISYLPALFGLHMAGYVIREISELL
ncbi:tRNA threonylcarbamoyladenosine dehydratase [Haliscomenobacter hydrossis]|uniref:UBA/THIF-type NAD/FAD binding protein n=1 Tax=Haliscomenobacter hydrossis (strain ATCC 27775 / DSM 1100 / LMG 10767 / O) TaxID=760192 RepID=F4L5X3_HALH1|nr:tRNA threonylcarbamoyladenosine dehydratase [Haliscomenobacter hydrossis]AEE52083.1 UBA/THIF-type NAD/FAD binding protein [Haliscomenobacter hydrossis DSM 1100]